MTQQDNPEKSIGLLPHEAAFVLANYDKSEFERIAARELYVEGITAHESKEMKYTTTGVTAFESRRMDRKQQILGGLSLVIRYHDQTPYPDEKLSIATYGSRVTVNGGDWVQIFDIATHDIPGMPEPEDVTIVSATSAVGSALINSKAGHSVTWELDDGTSTTVEIVQIDQQAQAANYLQVL